MVLAQKLEMYSYPNHSMIHFDWSNSSDIQVFTSFGENYVRDWRHSKVNLVHNNLFENADKNIFPWPWEIKCYEEVVLLKLLKLTGWSDHSARFFSSRLCFIWFCDHWPMKLAVYTVLALKQIWVFWMGDFVWDLLYFQP